MHWLSPKIVTWIGMLCIINLGFNKITPFTSLESLEISSELCISNLIDSNEF